ncbi:MurR/RpiR family transcriptional regulator [Lysobacter sp. ISL-50]|uniref:MurR/RpiR family transcriptional regulator n=1 Tax=unclassified Lysobacter TaxID=2635362 RepID=UPI001BE8BC2F|nr:MurR/RpiR family transcriptional regulator [Lysobacter sp. ISL-42]MBT2752653.1 MurR/RpiR family transcriptional regulator [Lysobacter sp. ISL-50]MBT2777392.1 MurR/RpiR family transcriptional regulator [Lysobacter sp. ISL-54]MBT2783583.1 MurR/RpiR family transcriptional regulator [Lysobacter sp. ISL-52]
MSDNLIPVIRGALDQLRPAERKVGEVVLADLDFSIHASISELAARAGVSEPSVTRFCRAVGCESLRQFKVQLAHSLAAGVPYQAVTIDKDDDAATLVHKVCDSIAVALQDVRERIDPAALDAAAALIAGARRVCCIGVGSGSGVVAQDAFLRFLRLDIAASAHSDGHLQRLAAGMLDSRDVLLAISLSGRSPEINDSVRIAKERGARVIALTHMGTPLGWDAQVPLLLPPSSAATPYSPGVSRLMQLTVIDMLAIAVALRQEPEVLEKARRAKAELERMQSPRRA